jgi:2-dehydropantoate 2-reductase
VHFLARGEHLRAIREHGLRVDSINGDFVVSPAHATDQPAEVGPVQVVLVAVKSWQLDSAIDTIRPLVGPETAVVPLLNGVEAPGSLSAAFGPEPVLGGMCGLSVLIAGPGHIRHVAIEPFIAFGELDNRPSPRAEALRDALVEARVKARVPDDILLTMWEKFLLIATWSGLGSITRAPIGVWRSLPESRALAEQALAEIVAVAQAHGVGLTNEHAAKTLAFLDGVNPAGMASMQRDVLDGKPSELEAQNGAVVRLGQQKGVHTPVHSFIYASLLPQEREARGDRQ